MKLLKIGDNLINEKYFIGLFDTFIEEDENSIRYYSLEARWLEADTLQASVVGNYRCTCESEGKALIEAQDEALRCMRL